MTYRLDADTSATPVTSDSIVGITRALAAQLRAHPHHRVRWLVTNPAGMVWAGIDCVAGHADVYESVDELYRGLAYVAALAADGLLPLTHTGPHNPDLADEPTDPHDATTGRTELAGPAD